MTKIKVNINQINPDAGSLYDETFSIENIGVILQTAMDGFWLVNLQGRLLEVNEAYCRMSGYNRLELLTMCISDLEAVESPDETNIHIKKIMSQVEDRFETIHRRKDGSLMHVEISAKYLSCQDGNCVTFIRDITARKQSEIDLQVSEERLNLFFSQSLDGLFFMLIDQPIEWNDSIDKEKTLDYIFGHQRVTRVNKAMLEQYRATEEQFYGLTINDFFAHDITQGREVWRRFFDAGHLHVDTREKRFDGTDMIIEGDYICMYDLQNRITGHFGIQRDVTEARQAAEALEKRNRELKLLLGTASDLLEFDTKDEIYNYLGETLYQLSGADYLMVSEYNEQNKSVSIRQVLGLQSALSKIAKVIGFDLMHVQIPVSDLALQMDLSIRKQIYRVEGGFYTLTIQKVPRAICKGLEKLLRIEEIFSIGCIWKGNYYGGVTFGYKNGHQLKNADLVESIVNQVALALSRKYSEQSLIESEEKYRSIFENTGTATIIVDARDNILMANEECMAVTGYSPKQLLGTSWTNYVAPESLSWMKRYNILKRRLPGNTPYRYEAHLVNANGEVRYANLSIGMIPSTDLLVVSMLDITEHKRAEEKQMLFRTLVDQSKDAFEILDPATGRFLDINERACQDLGYSRDELLALSVFDIDPLVSPNVFKTIMNGIRESGSHLWEGVHLRKDGSSFPVEVNLKFVTLDHEYIVSVVRDISQRKVNEDALLKLSRAVEQSPVSILITNTKGEIEYCNPKVTKITGYQLTELLGKNPRIFSSGEKPKGEYRVLWDTILSGKEWSGEFHNKKKNGELFWEHAAISPIINEKGKVTHLLAVKEDITERKKTIGELVLAKEKAEESDKLKSAFLANMSHEIRTPMNGILGFAELLQEPDLTGEEQQKFIGIIEKSGERMLHIIDNLMNISKIEAGQMEVLISSTDVNQLMESIVNFFRPEVERKKMELIWKNSLTTTETHINTDREKVYAILSNLVKNAIKYSTEGSIEIGYEKKGMFCVFFIKDTGSGIPQNRIQGIFDRFVQGDITTKQALEGVGLGLSITKGYVEILGGAIWVESQVGKGSVFYFTIPCNEESNLKPAR